MRTDAILMYYGGMAQWHDDREDQMIGIVDRLGDLGLHSGMHFANYGEWQLALETSLAEAARKNFILPTDLIDAVRDISEELLPKAFRSRQRELVPA